jgi:hypothetical protein
MAERVFAAIERGSQVNVDLSDKWDHWPYARMQIEEVRMRLDILPAQAAVGRPPTRDLPFGLQSGWMRLLQGE